MKVFRVPLSVIILFLYGIAFSAHAQQLMRVEEPPVAGTYYSVQLPDQAPFPFNPFPELDVYSSEGLLFYDDSDVDYVALKEERKAKFSMRQGGGEMMTEDGPPVPGEGGGSSGDSGTNIPPTFLTSTNLCLWPPVFLSSNSLSLLATNTVTNGVYDLFNTTNLAPNVPGLNLTNWLWLMRGASGQTNFTITNISTAQVQSYYLLGTMQDSDGDGLTDAYEKLVSHSNPNNADTDGDGISDYWELALGTNPNFNESAQSSTRVNYLYRGDGRLQTASGANSKALILDAEGNITQITP